MPSHKAVEFPELWQNLLPFLLSLASSMSDSNIFILALFYFPYRPTLNN